MISNKIRALLMASFLVASGPSVAAEYIVDTTASKISFSGEQAAEKFTGSFEKWEATVDFDPAKPEAGSIDVTIFTDSAKTGNPMYDGTLPKDDWFNAAAFPKATFKSTKISAIKDGAYKAEGDLAIKDVTKPMVFHFTLDETKTPTVVAAASFTVDRLAYGLGVKSDGEAEWVSKDIAITLDIRATKKAD